MKDLSRLYPAHPKDRGQWAELLFMATAVRIDLKVAMPYGDNARYDFIVESAGELSRVQVKCTSVLRYGYYRCICCWSRRTADATRRNSIQARPGKGAAGRVPDGEASAQKGSAREGPGKGTASAVPNEASIVVTPSGLQPARSSLAQDLHHGSGRTHCENPGQRRPGGQAMRYTKRDVDFIAIYVIPDDSWFIIPIEKIRHKVLDLPPLGAGSRSRWEQFRDAWHLLGADPNRCVNLDSATDMPVANASPS